MSTTNLQAGTSLLNGLVLRASDGDEIVLADGVHTLTGELSINKRLTLRAQNPGRAIVKYDCPQGAAPGWTPEWAQAVYPHAPGTVLDGLAFCVTNCKTIRLNGAVDVVLRNLTSAAAIVAEDQECGGYWFLEASKTTRLRLENITLPLHASYGFFFHDGNTDTTATGITLNGSVWQHAWRVSDQNGLTIDKSTLNGTQLGATFKNTGGISLRGGCSRVRVTNSTVDRPGIGTQTAPPMNGKFGETPWVDDVRFEACTLPAGYAIHPTGGEGDAAEKASPGARALMKTPTNLWINGTRVDVPPVPTAADVAAATGIKPEALDLLRKWLAANN